MCRTKKVEVKYFKEPQHKNARPYKREKYKYKEEEYV